MNIRLFSDTRLAGQFSRWDRNVDSLKAGDRVEVARRGWAASDIKFGAFQKYPLALEENLMTLDPQISLQEGSGVMANLATVVAALSICMILGYFSYQQESSQ